jgi:hypothetical protein
MVFYSISRGTAREVGHLYLMSDGTTATVSGDSGSLGTVGVYFTASVLAGNLRLEYSSDNLGTAAILRYRVQKFLTT